MFIQRLFDRGETPTPIPAPVPAPIVVRPPPCPCTTRSPGAAQEVLSGLLLVIRQQAMQLQSQIMGENTRVLTDVQDVTSDANIRTTSTQKESADRCHPPRKELVPRSSLQRTNVQRPAKQESSSNDINRKSGKTKKDARSNVLRVPVRRRGVGQVGHLRRHP